MSRQPHGVSPPTSGVTFRHVGNSTIVNVVKPRRGLWMRRKDVRLDGGGRPRPPEIGCNPDLGEGVALARSAERAGIGYAELLQRILESALESQPFEVDVPMMAPPVRHRAGAPR